MAIEVQSLSRGGYLIDTPIGQIQFGSPPETIKDTIPTEKGVPTIFVLPVSFFNWIKGISIAELEFPIYYNYFLKKRKTIIICNEEQKERIIKVLEQSLFGPQNPDFSSEFPDNPGYGQNIVNEMNYFKIMEFEDVVEFKLFENNLIDLDGVKISLDSENNFDISYDDTFPLSIPGNIEYKPKYVIGERLPEPFKPPLFAMTCLGPSNGFDPEENTSGFILWVNHNGIMIDPPVNSTEWLLDSNVSPKFIDSIILTHCHADHDAGTFQKILEEGRVSIYTTKTILNSFLTKYSALTGVSSKYLMSLFDFYPIEINQPIFIHGAKFTMIYSLHSIPTIGFHAEFQSKTMAYSSDHNNDPELHKKLFEENIIDEDRFDDLRNFPWNSEVIFHEAGFPPLHTSIDYLNSLPPKTQKKLQVYHISDKAFPKKTNLNLCKFGIQNTIAIKTKEPNFETCYRIVGLLKGMDIFKDIPINKVQQFITILEKKRYKKGDCIIKKGTYGDKFYIIYSGNVSIQDDANKNKKLFGAYDYFGEIALMANEVRTKNVYAETDVSLYYINKAEFYSFINNTEFKTTLTKLTEVRDDELWSLLSSSKFIKILKSTQRMIFETLLVPEKFKGSGTILKEGTSPDKVYIIKKGNVIVKQSGENVAILQRGDFVGMTSCIYYDTKLTYSFEYANDISLYSIDSDNLIDFLNKFPGLIMKLDYLFKQYLFHKL